MNTTLRTSIHKCLVTAEAIDFLTQHAQDGIAEVTLMPAPAPESLVMLKTIEPPHHIQGGHIRAVYELTERVEETS